MHKSKIYLITFVWLFLLLLWQPLFAQADSTFKKGDVFNALLPVNAALPKGQRLNLAVTTPKDFCPIESLSDYMKAQMRQTEWIPCGEKDPYKWSQIVTLHSFLNNRVSAKTFVIELRESILMQGSDAQVLFEEHVQEKDHAFSTVVIVYTHNKRREIVYCVYFSGPYDIAGVQYAIHLTQEISPQIAQKQIMEFMRNNVKLIKF